MISIREDDFILSKIGKFPKQWTISMFHKLGINVIDGDRGKEYPKSEDFSDSGYCLFLNAKNVTKSGFKFSEKMFINEDKDRKLGKGKLTRNDIVITTRGTIGNIAIYDKTVPFENVRLNSGMAILRIKNKELNIDYFFQVLNSNIIKNQLLRVVFGSAQPQLTIGLLNKLLLPLPPLPEQRKIAEILSTWDGAIAKTELLIEALRQRKKGLMQRLLTGELQFFKFKINEKKKNWKYFGLLPSNWKLVKLGDYAYIKARIGWRGLASDEYTTSGPFLIAGKHIQDTQIMWDQCDHISEFRYEESHEIMLRENDVIISKDGTLGRIGFIENLPGKATINGTMMLIRPNDHFDSKFVSFYLQSDYFQGLIKKRVSGSSVPHIFQRDMVKLFIPMPPKSEQTKIAQFLTIVDDEIIILTKKLDFLKLQKKGLMQRLLTGQVRVKVER